MFQNLKMISYIYSQRENFMNLNEHCLLKFLGNPDEITELSDVIFKNFEEIEKIKKSDNN